MRKWFYPFSVLMAIVLAGVSVFAQRERGQMLLRVRDQNGGTINASVVLSSEVNAVHETFRTNLKGDLRARDLPFGPYRLVVAAAGFDTFTRWVEIHSEVPVTISAVLVLAPVKSSVTVKGSTTLIDPQRTRTVHSISPAALHQALPAQLGRGVLNAVDSESGWLFEANGVLHPRGSEYDVQFVTNGQPDYQNRSPAFAPPINAQNVQSLRVMTSGFPAEYGRKLGGVVEVTTAGHPPAGLHMESEVAGGSFGTAGASTVLSLARGASQFMISGVAGVTHRYLDPPVIANYSNRGSDGSSTASFARELSHRDHVSLSVSYGELHYEVPNEVVQQKSGQRQDAEDTETSARADYDHIISPTLLLSAEASIRNDSFHLWSNDLSTPVVISQQRGYRQGYGRVTLAGSLGMQNWMIGADALFGPAHEALRYRITNASLFDPGTAARFNFADHRYDIEPAAFAQTHLHASHWNLSLGIRFDHYGFVVNQSAWSPRIGIARYFPKLDLLLHADYDRIFNTPAMENLLLASSPQVSQISPDLLRLPVEPARADYYELGVTQGIWRQVRLDVNAFQRDFRNFPDDDTLLNTGVSFPISDARARIEGVEASLAMPGWGRFTGFIHYAWQEGIAQGPITGGLFIGAENIASVGGDSRFWISQDQRNTLSATLRCQLTRRFWLATEASYGSGLPVELDSGDINYNFLLAQYGAPVLNQVNFARGRVRPSYSLGAGAGFAVYESDNKKVSLRLQGSNLTNHLNVINFASLFSGTALAPPRSFDLRLQAGF